MQFISELIETAKYCNHEKVEMFVMMLHNTLPLAVGTSDAIINKHVAAVGTRFKSVESLEIPSSGNKKIVYYYN